MTQSHPNYFGNAAVEMLDPNDIIVGDRIGYFHPKKAEALGKLMAKDGQHAPILIVKRQVGRKPSLVAGLHRLHGAINEGLPIAAVEVFGTSEELRAIEASENMHRRDFSPIERACFVYALSEDAKKRAGMADLSPQEIAIKARWDKAQGKIECFSNVEDMAEAEGNYTRVTVTHVYGWREDVAASMGLSKESVKLDLALYRGIVELMPDLAEALSKHPIVGSNATTLRKIVAIKDVSTRRRVVEDLVKHPALTLDDALVRAAVRTEKTAAEGAAKFTNAITSSWSRLSIAEKRAYLPTFIEQLTPALRADLREILEAE